MVFGLVEHILWFGAGALVVGVWSKKKSVADELLEEDAVVRTFGECAQLMSRKNLITSLACIFSNCFIWFRLADGDMDLRALLIVFMKDVEGAVAVASESEEYAEEDRQLFKRRLEEVREFRKYFDDGYGDR